MSTVAATLRGHDNAALHPIGQVLEEACKALLEAIDFVVANFGSRPREVRDWRCRPDPGGGG